MKKLILFIPLLLWTVTMQAEPGLTVIAMDGTETQFALSQIGKITFDEDKMYLFDEDNNLLGSTELENVGNIAVMGTDEEEEEAVDNVNGQLKVWADPAQQQIVVTGLTGNQVFRVYNMQGQLMLTTSPQMNQNKIDVSSLANGTYLLQLGAQVVKFVKQ